MCQSTPRPGGYPIPIRPHPYPSLSKRGGGYLIQPWMGGGYSNPALDRGVPQSSLGWGRGYPDPALDGGVPQPWMGGYTNLGWGATPSLGGTPSHVRGVPQVPSPPGIASTCYGYAAGGVPLAFTQEDFLVDFTFISGNVSPRKSTGYESLHLFCLYKFCTKSRYPRSNFNFTVHYRI